MKLTEPKVILIGKSEVDYDGLYHYLDVVGAPEWTTDSEVGSEVLAEVAGRACYKSFAAGLNPNVTKVREGNEDYLANIAKQKHGSVYEHVSATLAFVDVSRIVTHEFVRHRAGVAFSQESLRYVRLDSLKMYYPRAFGVDFLKTVWEQIDWEQIATLDGSEADRDAWAVETAEKLESLFTGVGAYLEDVQRQLSDILRLDDFKPGGFEVKKKLTSSFRRLAPLGLATAIITTGNHRAWRHMITMRTSPAAEEEIRDTFWKVSQIMRDCFPNLYSDMIVGERVDGIPVVSFANEKI